VPAGATRSLSCTHKSTQRGEALQLVLSNASYAAISSHACVLMPKSAVAVSGTETCRALDKPCTCTSSGHRPYSPSSACPLLLLLLLLLLVFFSAVAWP
jgi:hypothetical protein